MTEYNANEMDEKVTYLMHQGYAPSEIDVKLGLLPGQAHDAVVHMWRRYQGALKGLGKLF